MITLNGHVIKPTIFPDQTSQVWKLPAGIACKATYCEIDGVGKPIFKSPKTGAWKKSHRGLLRVNEDLSVEQDVTWEHEGGVLRTVFKDGRLLVRQSLSEIRERLNRQEEAA